MATVDGSDEIIRRALEILDSRVRAGPIFDTPAKVKDYLRLYFAEASAQGREEFAVLFLDSQHRLIEMMAQLGFRQGWYYQPLMGAAPMPGWAKGPNGTLVPLS